MLCFTKQRKSSNLCRRLYGKSDAFSSIIVIPMTFADEKSKVETYSFNTLTGLETVHDMNFCVFLY